MLRLTEVLDRRRDADEPPVERDVYINPAHIIIVRASNRYGAETMIRMTGPGQGPHITHVKESPESVVIAIDNELHTGAGVA